MAYDYRKLVGRIVEKYGSRTAFAKAAHTTDRVLSFKLNNKTKLTQDDITLWTRLLDIDDSDIYSYFFTRNSQAN